MLKKSNSVDKNIIIIEPLFVLDIQSHIHLNQGRNYNSGVVSAKYTRRISEGHTARYLLAMCVIL